MFLGRLWRLYSHIYKCTELWSECGYSGWGKYESTPGRTAVNVGIKQTLCCVWEMKNGSSCLANHVSSGMKNEIWAWPRTRCQITENLTFWLQNWHTILKTVMSQCRIYIRWCLWSDFPYRMSSGLMRGRHCCYKSHKETMRAENRRVEGEMEGGRWIYEDLKQLSKISLDIDRHFILLILFNSSVTM